MKLIDIIVLIVVAVLVAIVIRKMIRKGNSCSCGCSTCPYSDSCKKKK